MRFRLIWRGFLRYGATRSLGKALAGILWVSSPAYAADPVTILALGDSLTQGYGLPAADGFVPQLERWLAGQGTEVKIINGGVSGDTTAGGAARVEWSLTPETDAMIVTLGGNDLLRGIDPRESRRNLEKILEVADARDVRVLLVGLQAPGNYGPEYKTAFDAIYPELSKAYGALYVESFFAGLGVGTAAELQRYFQADGLHPNKEGVARIVAALGPEVMRLIAIVK